MLSEHLFRAKSTLGRVLASTLLKAHERCRSEFILSEEIPTRLLEIKFTNDMPTIRMTETSGQPRERRSYIALSYCWGKAIFPTLRTDNEKHYKEGIPLSTIPKTFQDAIQIAGWVRIQNLWIASLCILHNFLKPIGRESPIR